MAHEQEVCAIDVYSNGNVASGDRGYSPVIFVWSLHDLKIIHTFKNNHNSDIYILKFVNQGKFLVSCSKRLTPAIIVHDLDTGQIIHSCYVNEFIRGISTINYLVI